MAISKISKEEKGYYKAIIKLLDAAAAMSLYAKERDLFRAIDLARAISLDLYQSDLAQKRRERGVARVKARAFKQKSGEAST